MNNVIPKIVLSAVVAMVSLLAADNLSADIIVDPKGHDPVQLEQDMMECRELVANIDFNLASDHQGKAVLRGAAVGGSMAAIAGGNKESRRRSAAGGALVGGLQRNKAKRVDGSVADVQRKEAQRNCLAGRGYNPLS